jgi:3-phosphoglycerate kinase
LESYEKSFWNHELADKLGIGESTLRKWCIELEKNGYTFIKGVKDSRAFTVHDLTALTTFKELIKVDKLPKEEASKVIAERFGRREGNEGTTPVQMEENRSIHSLEKMVEKLLERTEKQEEFNRALIERLEEQDRYIKESIEKRDRLLLENIRKNQEEQAAAREEEKQKKKFIEKIKEFFNMN